MALQPLIPDDPNQPKQLQGLGVPKEPPPLPQIGGMPSLPSTSGMGGLKPIVSSPRQQQEQALQQALQPKTQQPETGFWHKLAHGLNVARNVAESAITPSIALQDPTNPMNQQANKQRNQAQLAGLQKQDVAEQDAFSKRNLESSQAREAEARADALENPDKSDKQNWTETKDYVGPNGEPVEQNKNTGEFRVAQLPQGIRRYTAPVKPTPEQFKPGVSAGKNAYGAYVPGVGWEDAHGNPLPDFAPMPSFAQTGMYEPLPVYNPTTGGIQPGTFNRRTGATSPTGAGGGLQPIAPGEMTPLTHELSTARDADTRFRVMMDSLPEALKGNQQAQVNLLANHIGMTLGLQKGARISQAVWEEAMQSAPWLQRVAARFGPDGYLTGVTLSPEQIHQMVGLGQDRRMRQWQQVKDAGQNYGIDVSKMLPKDLEKPNETLKTPSGAGGATIVQHSASTGAYRYSTDGGKTWQTGQPPK